MKFPAEIKSIHYNAIWVCHPRDLFAYFLETIDKQIDLLIKQELVTQSLKKYVGEHPFCVLIEDSRHFACPCVPYARNVA